MPSSMSTATIPALRRLAPMVCLAAACGAVLAASPAKPQGDPRLQPVARVNGRPIPARDFDLAVQLQFAGVRGRSVGLQELQDVRDKVLERLIDSELLYQKASEQGTALREADVEAEVKRMEKRLGGAEALDTLLRQQGMSPAEFRDQVRRTLIVGRFVDRLLKDDQVTDEEVRRYYDQNPKEMIRPEAVRVSQIMVKVEPDAAPKVRAEARQKIEAILKELRGGADFADMARQHSDGPEASRGGDTGLLIRGAGAPPPLERAAFALQPGETSDIVETRRGFHILRVTQRRPEGPIPFEQARDAIRARLQSERREQAVNTYVQGLRAHARIERFLKETAAPR
jgi:peptidyl-prolyl cis-trans isomerase C